VCCAALLALAPGAYVLAHEGGGFDHESKDADEPDPPLLLLNHGEKWQTDEPMRRAMSNVRDSVAGVQHAIDQNTATPAQYDALSRQINEQLSHIITNSKLTRKAQENFYAIFLDLVDGKEMLRQSGMQRDGALKIIGALERYPEFFDHAGWRALGDPEIQEVAPNRNASP
jgi:hypothetical protein